MSLDQIRTLAVVVDRHHSTSARRGSMPNIPAMGPTGLKRHIVRRKHGDVSAVETGGDTMAPVIQIDGVAKKYRLGKDNHVHALRGTSIEIHKGEMVAIMGPSGSGKSTLMHIVGCLDTPDGGSVVLNGRRVDTLRDRELTRVRSAEIGFIFQGFNLIPTLSAIDNVALAGEYAGMARREAVARAEELLDLVGLAERKRHLPSELSGGQQQRVAIARSLMNRPAIVLGDEPTGDLDTSTSEEIMGVMREVNLATGTTFVLVTHNPEVAEACDRTIRMRDGAVEDDGLAGRVEEAFSDVGVIDPVFATGCCA